MVRGRTLNMRLGHNVYLVWLECPGCHGNRGPGVLQRHTGTQHVYWVLGEGSVIIC